MSKKSGDTNDVLKCRPSELPIILKTQFLAGAAAFVWGPPGIAKSQIAQQLATSMGIAFIDMRLSQMDPTDLRGIPYPVEVGGRETVRWSTPFVLPQDLNDSFIKEVEAEETPIHFANPIGSNNIHYCTDPTVSVKALNPAHQATIVSQTNDSVVVAIRDANQQLVGGKVRVTATGKAKAVLALEEFNSAPPTVQAAAYQFVLDKRLGEYIVPDGVHMVAMGNRETDKGITYKMAPPVSNRFVHYEMEVNFKDWQRWAITHNVHEAVIGYLSAFNNHLFNFDAGTASRGFATPRSWSFVSDILHVGDDVPDGILMHMITGAIGSSPGIEFHSFRRQTKDLPRATDVLTGQVSTLKIAAEPSLCYALVTSMCYELKKEVELLAASNKDWKNTPDGDNYYKKASNFISFSLNNFPADIMIMGMRSAVLYNELPFRTTDPTFKDFVKNHGKMIMEA